jgi:hypothetical protein
MSHLKSHDLIRIFLVFTIVAFIAMCAAPLAAAPAATGALTIDDLFRFRTVGDPQRSPDGKWVAHNVGTTDLEKDKRDIDIRMVSWDGDDDRGPDKPLLVPSGP